MGFFSISRRAACLLLVATASVHFLGVGGVRGQDSDGQEADGPTLKIGDVAPPLKDIAWLKGESIDGFRQGQVYVLDFWATWCGPCIQAMPHLDKLEKKFGDKGLVVVAITTVDRANTAEAIRKFVDERAGDLQFRFAMCETDVMQEQYMAAARRDAIPCSFVIDQQGKLAFIGLPGETDIVIEKVLNRSWKGQESIDELKSLDERVARLGELLESDPAKMLVELSAIEKEYPHIATTRQFVIGRLGGLLRIGSDDEVKQYFNDATARLFDAKDTIQLSMLAGYVLSPELNPKRRMAAEAEAAIEKTLAIDPTDSNTTVMAAYAYATGGQVDKANLLLDRAIAACEDELLKDQLRQMKSTLQILGNRLNAK